MSPVAWSRLVVLLGRIARGPGHAPHSHREETSGEIAADVYRPRGTSRGVLLAVHGATLAGPRDGRLEHFAACTAASGITTVVPRLPGLASLRFDPDDVDVVAGEIQRWRGEGAGRVGLIGFSLGGSLALLAAARPGPAAWASFVVTIGAHHDLTTLLTIERFTAEPAPGDAARDSWAHFRLGELYRNRGVLALDAEQVTALEATLSGWCDALGSPEKEAAVERFRSYFGSIHAMHGEPEGDAALAALSPVGRLHALACPVSLLHAPDDDLVPPEHAWRLLQEVPARCRPRLLVTPLLSHVSARPLARPWHIPSLVRAFAPLAFA
jgi:acetyl esterase/lipase